MIGEKSTTKRFMHSRCGLVRKPITEPLYTSNIQHDPQFTIRIKGNKMCFPVEIHIHLTSLITRDSSSSEQYFVAQGHYDEVNEWMLPQICPQLFI